MRGIIIGLLAVLSACTHEVKDGLYVKDGLGRIYVISHDDRCRECYNVKLVSDTSFNRLFNVNTARTLLHN